MNLSLLSELLYHVTINWFKVIITYNGNDGNLIFSSSACYILSGFLDAFDGHAARAFNQSTKFGAMLDMLTDR